VLPPYLEVLLWGQTVPVTVHVFCLLYYSGEQSTDIDIQTEESDAPAMIQQVDETSDVDDMEPTPLLTLAGAREYAIRLREFASANADILGSVAPRGHDKFHYLDMLTVALHRMVLTSNTRQTRLDMFFTTL
jgi:hypothetical protein